jgi:hypothetical protein
MDIRLKQLSYSSRLALHDCPRKFQLYRLNVDSTEESVGESLTFLFGHCLGEGIQNSMCGDDWDTVLWKLFLRWDMDLFEYNPKQNKGFFQVVYAVSQFHHSIRNSLLKDWEVVYYNGVPTAELSFIIELPDGFKYRGFVDLVLHHVETGEVMVLEIKSTSAKTLNPAQYKNSSQAVGYSVVLDNIFPDLSSYKVLYLPYLTGATTYEPMLFEKSYLQRALWITELLLDKELIEKYDDVGVFPMYGESCFKYYRECEYYSNCTLSTQYLTKPVTQEMEDSILESHKEFQIQVSFVDLINSQLGK